MVRIEKPLPGEFEGTLDPEEYGFSVIKDDLMSSDEEQTRQVEELYAKAKERTGITIPALEEYLEAKRHRRPSKHFGAVVAREVKRIGRWKGLDN